MEEFGACGEGRAPAHPAVGAMPNRTLRIYSVLVLLWVASCTGDRERPLGPVSAVDDLGRTVNLQSPAQRIVSLAPSITETLFTLGLDSTVIGVTDFCDYPPRARQRAHVGGMLNPALEKIVSLRPDLVLMSGSGNVQTDFTKLSKLGLTVFVTYPKTLDGIFKSILDIGALVGRPATADSLVRALRSREANIQHQAHQHKVRSVLFLVSVRPLISVGPGTFIAEMIRQCNATNISENAPIAYPMLSREEILSGDPDCIVVTSDAVKDRSEVMDAFSEWQHLRAITDSAVTLVDADLVTRPGPRIVEGLAALCSAIHGAPEKP
jgi:iron complex transport system substrate-binding protein